MAVRDIFGYTYDWRLVVYFKRMEGRAPAWDIFALILHR